MLGTSDKNINICKKKIDIDVYSLLNRLSSSIHFCEDVRDSLSTLDGNPFSCMCISFSLVQFMVNIFAVTDILRRPILHILGQTFGLLHEVTLYKSYFDIS